MKLLALSCVLAVITIAAHSSGLRGEFVFDDLPVIVENPSLGQFPPINAFLHLRGVANASFHINAIFGGIESLGFHIVNIAIHAVNVICLWLVLRILFQWQPSPWPSLVRKWSEGFSFWIALIWGVHPITTQAVVYTVQRHESLWSGFFLLGMLFYLYDLLGTRGGETGKAFGFSLHHAWLLLAIICFWLGMGCKEPIVLSLLVLPIIDYVLGCFTLRAWARRRLIFIGLLLLPILVAVPTVIMPGLTSDAVDTSAGFFATMVSPLEYWRTQPEATFVYIGKVLRPINQCFDYLWPPQGDPLRLGVQWSCFLALLVATAGGVIRRRGWGLLAALFFLNLSTTYLIPLTDLVVEHRVYLASAWFVGLLPVAALMVGERWNWSMSETRKTAVASHALAVCLVFWLGVLTFNRSRLYESRLLLWEQTAAVAPWNYRAKVNYAAELASAGRHAEAVDLCKASLELESFKREPDFQRAKVFDALALAHSRNGELEAAVKACQFAVDLTPGGSDHLLRLASIYGEHRKWREAEAALRAAIRNRPERGLLYEKLGELLAFQKAWEAARQAYKTAKQYQSNDMKSIDVDLALIDWMLGNQETSAKMLESIPDADARRSAWGKLAIWLTESGRLDEARQAEMKSGGATILTHKTRQRSAYRDYILAGDYTEADSLIQEGLRDATGEDDRLFWRVESILLAYRKGSENEAVRSLSEMLEKHPSEGLIWGALGDVYRWQKDWDNAIKHCEKARQLGHEDSYLLNNLASMLAESEPVRAESYLRRSVEVDPTNFQAWHNLGNSLIRQGRIEESIPCYQRAIDINPAFVASRQTLERIRGAQGTP